jgi:GNAT superfamily N-acetyltransferase
VLKWGDALVGFCAVRVHPSGTMNFARSIHRLVILPDFQGLGVGTRFLEEICKIYVNRGIKVHIRTAHESLGIHMGHTPTWRATGRNGKQGAISNGKINGKNQNMYIVNSTRYSYEYMGEDWALPHKEIVVDSLSNIDINEMRKMLVELKKHNYVTVVHSRVRETTALNKLCCELGIRTELLYLNNHEKSVLNGKHRGKMKLVSLKPGHKPVYRKVA